MPLYKHLGVAVALSPRLDALLAETVFHAEAFAPRLSLIHAGRHSVETEDRLRAAMRKAEIPDEEIIWVEGDPDQAIVNAIRDHGIDLLLAGALEKEQALRYYLGSVAHNLVREAPSSLLLLTEPSVDPKPLRRIVVVTDYTEYSLIALTRAIRFAEKEQAEQLTVIRVLSDYGTAMVLSEGIRRDHARVLQNTTRGEEEELLRNLVDAAGSSSIPIDAKCIEGHTGYVAAHFAREQKADLLVMPSSNWHSHFLERLFPSDMEWVLREIPCNLWVIRERIG